jgi:hypothetical protein
VTSFYGVSAPLASGKTTAAVEFAGRAARVGEKFIIAQPSINLINQSIRQFQERWPNLAVRAIHSETTNNVVRGISDHTKASTTGEVLFVTHAALMQSVYWRHRKDWHLIIDEAPQVFYHAEFTLPVNHDDLLPALEVEPYNVRYSRLVRGDVALLEEIAINRRGDQVHALFQEFGAKLASNRWDLFVLNEQWERFQTGQITDGKLLVFGLIDTAIFGSFSTTTIMSANLECTAAYQYLVQSSRTATGRSTNAIDRSKLPAIATRSTNSSSVAHSPCSMTSSSCGWPTRTLRAKTRSAVAESDSHTRWAQ